MNYIHNDPLLKDRRKALRRNSSSEEIILWNSLRNKRLGKKFRRQFSIGPYIVDFYCTELKLIIELDGIQHYENKEYDREKDNFMSAQGYCVLRFPNSVIQSDLQTVIELIQRYIAVLSTDAN